MKQLESFNVPQDIAAPDFLMVAKGKSNLYANSLLALDAQSGNFFGISI